MTYGIPHRHLSECESTNDHASRWANDPKDPAPDGALVTADTQTKGRGRRGRSWESAPGDDVLMSLVVRGEGTLETVWQIGYVCALAVTDALQERGVDSAIKWPNDILVQGRKASGILVEMPALYAGAGWAAIAGIGVNVNRAAFGEDRNYHYPPTSLYLETGRRFDVPELARDIALAVERWETIRRYQGWKPVLDAVRLRLAVGVDVRFGDDVGTLQDIDEEGQAIVRTFEGTLVEWRTVDQDVTGNGV